jgi:hypothetical protein
LLWLLASWIHGFVPLTVVLAVSAFLVLELDSTLF